MKNMCVITHTILGILYVFVHLMPGNALFSVHLLTARHQLIWPSTLIYKQRGGADSGEGDRRHATGSITTAVP